VVWGLLSDLALFHHRPSPLSLAGAALVCASSFVILYFEQRSSGGGSGSKEGNGLAWPAQRPKRSSSGALEAAAPPAWQQLEGGGSEGQQELAEGCSLAEGGGDHDAASPADEHARLVGSAVQRSA
jgi:hypothetical protein